MYAQEINEFDNEDIESILNRIKYHLYISILDSLLPEEKKYRTQLEMLKVVQNNPIDSSMSHETANNIVAVREQKIVAALEDLAREENVMHALTPIFTLEYSEKERKLREVVKQINDIIKSLNEKTKRLNRLVHYFYIEQ